MFTAKALKTKLPLREAADTLELYAGKPLKAAFLARGVRALTELADRLEPNELELAVAGESRASTLVLALSQPGAIGLLRPESDPLVRARVRGLARRDELIASDGGTLTTSAVAKRLKLTTQAVHKRRNAGKLLAFELGRRGLHFPAWQFTDSGTLDGLEDVLAALNDEPPLAIVRFFLSGNLRLGRRRPLDALRKHDVASVVSAAKAFDAHGAA